MNLVLGSVTCSASDLGTFGDCEARYYHGIQRYKEGLLPTDRIPADVSSAVHDALMVYHRAVEQAHLKGGLPPVDAAQDRLRAQIARQLGRKRLNAAYPEVADRLAKLASGIDRVAEVIVTDAPQWAVDPATGDLLVWEEAPLDHGPGIQAVELTPGFLVRTRPDVIGLRMVGQDRYRAVVRDFKARTEVVDPEYDDGILIRAIWVMLELENPRCRWFLGRRVVAVDTSGVDVETVNIMHAGGEEFLLKASLSERQLLIHRDRIVGTMVAMRQVQQAGSAEEVRASPNGRCQNWCPFLNRCQEGMAHVRKYCGEEVLEARLAEA